MRTLKKLSYLALACVIACLSLETVQAKSNAEPQETRVDIILQGKAMDREETGDHLPIGIIRENRTYIPLRNVSETMGYKVDYDHNGKKIKISDARHAIEMNIGSRQLKVGEEKRTMDVAPILIDSKTYIPARYLMEAMGEPVAWDGESRIVILSELPKDPSATGKREQFTVDGHRFSLCLPEGLTDRVLIKQGKSLELYDRYNQEQSKDQASGHLYTILATKGSGVLDTPCVILYYKDGMYIMAAKESGVEYSLENKEFETQYNKSLEMLEKVFKTFKLTV